MIAIKDMEMPSGCADCNMTTCKSEDVPWNYVCSINLKDIDFNETDRAEHCPLVEIVTCKDCKYYRNKDDDEWCTTHSFKDNKFWVREDYYCADAERRK